jgi:integrase
LLEHDPRDDELARGAQRRLSVPGRARNETRQREGRGARRVLTDDEIKAVWGAASGPFGGIVKLCLLTAQRLDKVATVKWDDIVDGVWNIDTEEREKGNARELVLPDLVLGVVEAQPRFAGSPYVFAGRGARAYSGFSAAKTALDGRCGVSGWTLHDLRRTARSLMSRAGVTSDHAERVLGHAIGGVEGVYDRHAYREEKRVALATLATLIDGVVDPRANVVPLRESAQ